MARRKAPYIPDQLLEQLLAGADPRTAFDPNGLLDGLKRALAERALNAYSGESDRLIRLKAITQSGDRDHLPHCALEGRMREDGTAERHD